MLVLAKKLNRPVKYVETRSEHMSNSHHGRDQIAYVTLTAKNDGTVTGCKARGHRRHRRLPAAAHAVHRGAGLPGGGRLLQVPGDRLQRHRASSPTRCRSTPSAARAGRSATYWIELMMDKLARELDMDPLELRRKNFIRQGRVPVRDAAGHRLRLRRLPGRAGQAAGELRPGRVPHRAGRAAREGHPPRRGLLDLGRGVRPGAVTRRRPAGRGPAGGVLGVGDGARAPVRLGHRLLGLVAARPGPGHLVRADRGRPPGHRPRAGST